eukprot:6437491-Prymnesium_polylepis.1
MRRQRAEDQSSFLEKAAKNKSEVSKVRHGARAATSALLQEKAEAGRVERANDYLVGEEKAR